MEGLACNLVWDSLRVWLRGVGFNQGFWMEKTWQLLGSPIIL